MTDQEEQYIHFEFSIQNLNSAWKILQNIIKEEGNPLVGAAFQFALIEYSKPYKNSRGEKWHKLTDIHVPDKHKSLHKKILNDRDQIHAHADLTIRDAKIFVTNTNSGKIVTQIQNIVYGIEEISNLHTINNLIEKTLDNMYIELKRLEENLPINSK